MSLLVSAKQQWDITMRVQISAPHNQCAALVMVMVISRLPPVVQRKKKKKKSSLGQQTLETSENRQAIKAAHVRRHCDCQSKGLQESGSGVDWPLMSLMRPQRELWPCC